jgi:hypothetical protein
MLSFLGLPDGCRADSFGRRCCTYLFEHVLKVDTILVSLAHTSETSRLSVLGEIDSMVADCYGAARLAIFGRYHAVWETLLGERQLVQDWDRHPLFFALVETLSTDLGNAVSL